MLSPIIGNKGTGKTKRLLDLVNVAVEASKGDVVCVERGQMLTYDISHKARLIDTDTYGINGYESFYGFLCGICACNYDVTDIFVDATLKIGGKDYDNFADFIEKLSVLSEESNTRFTLTVSCDESELSDRVFEFAIKI